MPFKKKLLEDLNFYSSVLLSRDIIFLAFLLHSLPTSVRRHSPLGWTLQARAMGVPETPATISLCCRRSTRLGAVGAPAASNARTNINNAQMPH